MYYVAIHAIGQSIHNKISNHLWKLKVYLLYVLKQSIQN